VAFLKTWTGARRGQRATFCYRRLSAVIGQGVVSESRIPQCFRRGAAGVILNSMRLLITLLLSGLSSAQADDDALVLLREVASSARNTNTWRAEGVEVAQLAGRGMNNLRDEIHFKIAVQSPLKMRRENSGDDHTQSVCDGTDRLYTGDGLSFHRFSVPVGNECKFSLADFYELDENPASATVIGDDHVRLADGLHECKVIRVERNRDVQGDTKLQSVRTMCIDQSEHLILRDSTESVDAASQMHSTRAITFTSFERDPRFRPDDFNFSIPTGTIEDQGPQLGTDEPASIAGLYPIGPHILYPRLISKVAPSYTDEARESRLSGLVLVSLEVAQDGSPQNVKVVRGLGHGLDGKAIESVRNWHFNPGMRDGVPVAVGPLIVAVYFRLP
jgi:TonB family protein